MTERKKVNKLDARKTVVLNDYLRRNAVEGKIPHRKGDLAKAAADFLKFEISPSTIDTQCAALRIELRKNQHGGSRGPSKINMLEERVADLEEDVAKLDDQLTEMNAQVKYLIEGLCSKKERDGINGAHQPLLDEAIGRPS